MGIQQHHPDPAAEPPTAAQAASPGLPGMMEQLTRALLHAPAEPPAAEPTAAEPSAEAEVDDVAVEADVPAEPPTVSEEPPTVTSPAPRRPGAVLGELAFLDE